MPPRHFRRYPQQRTRAHPSAAPAPPPPQQRCIHAALDARLCRVYPAGPLSVSIVHALESRLLASSGQVCQCAKCSPTPPPSLPPRPRKRRRDVASETLQATIRPKTRRNLGCTNCGTVPCPATTICRGCGRRSATPPAAAPPQPRPPVVTIPKREQLKPHRMAGRVSSSFFSEVSNESLAHRRASSASIRRRRTAPLSDSLPARAQRYPSLLDYDVEEPAKMERPPDLAMFANTFDHRRRVRTTARESQQQFKQRQDLNYRQRRQPLAPRNERHPNAQPVGKYGMPLPSRTVRQPAGTRDYGSKPYAYPTQNSATGMRSASVTRLGTISQPTRQTRPSHPTLPARRWKSRSSSIAHRATTEERTAMDRLGSGSMATEKPVTNRARTDGSRSRSRPRGQVHPPTEIADALWRKRSRQKQQMEREQRHQQLQRQRQRQLHQHQQQQRCRERAERRRAPSKVPMINLLCDVGPPLDPLPPLEPLPPLDVLETQTPLTDLAPSTERTPGTDAGLSSEPTPHTDVGALGDIVHPIDPPLQQRQMPDLGLWAMAMPPVDPNPITGLAPTLKDLEADTDADTDPPTKPTPSTDHGVSSQPSPEANATPEMESQMLPMYPKHAAGIEMKGQVVAEARPVPSVKHWPPLTPVSVSDGEAGDAEMKACNKDNPKGADGVSDSPEGTRGFAMGESNWEKETANKTTKVATSATAATGTTPSPDASALALPYLTGRKETGGASRSPPIAATPFAHAGDVPATPYGGAALPATPYYGPVPPTPFGAAPIPMTPLPYTPCPMTPAAVTGVGTNPGLDDLDPILMDEADDEESDDEDEYADMGEDADGDADTGMDITPHETAGADGDVNAVANAKGDTINTDRSTDVRAEDKLKRDKSGEKNGKSSVIDVDAGIGDGSAECGEGVQGHQRERDEQAQKDTKEETDKESDGRVGLGMFDMGGAGNGTAVLNDVEGLGNQELPDMALELFDNEALLPVIG